MNAVDLIAEERRRQLLMGFTAEVDDEHSRQEILECAILTASDVKTGTDTNWPNMGWPEQRANSIRAKYGQNKISRLVICGALIAAEIDRLLRIEEKAKCLSKPILSSSPGTSAVESPGAS